MIAGTVVSLCLLLVQVDRQWYGTPLLWTRDDALGVWHHTEHVPALPKPAAAAQAAPQAAAAPAANGSTPQQPDSSPGAAADHPAAAASGQQQPVHPIVAATRAKMQQQAEQSGAAALERAAATAAAAAATAGAEAEAADAARASSPDGSGGFREDVEEALKCCLVLVDVDIPLVALSDGVHSRSFAGNGLVVFHGDNLGLVLVRTCRDLSGWWGFRGFFWHRVWGVTVCRCHDCAA